MGSISIQNEHHIKDDAGQPCVTLDQLVRKRAATHADRVLISYPLHETDFANYTGRDVDHITRRLAANLAATLQNAVPESLMPGEDSQCSLMSSLVVALVGISSLEYYFTFLALQRLGITTMFISPRLADQGYIYLLAKTGCQVAIASGPSYKTLERLDTDGSLEQGLALIPMIDSETLLHSHKVEDRHSTFKSVHNENQGFIIHSGGTTGLPKPVRLSAAAWILQAADIAKRIPKADTLSTLPLFHSFGLATLLRGLANGSRLSLLNAARPVTAAIIQEALGVTASETLVTVPYTLKFLAESSRGVQRLGMLRQVINAGSAIPDELGDELVAAGTNIFHLYGQTESGALMEPPQDRYLWSWVTPLPHAAPYLKFEPEGDPDQNIFHLVILPGLKQKVLSDRPDGSYGTKDLFKRHPTIPDLWKFVSRKDDIIVMLNGEKADPIPLEEALTASPCVRAAVAFGAGRDNLGLLVIRSAQASHLSRAEFVESIMPALKLGNARVPAYARVSLEMIVVKDAETPFPHTDKSTVIRPAFLKSFQDDIEKAYDSNQRLKASHAAGKLLSQADVVDLVCEAVSNELGARTDSNDGQPINGQLSHDQDFFDLGLDSLQASNIRSRLLRDIDVHGRVLPTNVVFDHPSITLLSKYMLDVHQGLSEDTTGESTETLARSMVRKYQDFQYSQVERLSPDAHAGSECVLLTGATGQVGTHILSELLKQDNVRSVFCIVRADDDTAARVRILAALEDALLLKDLSQQQVDKIMAYAGNLSQDGGQFGLSASTYQSICSSVTSIIHNAWAVNFNLTLQSFEAQSMLPTYNLINLALASTLAHKPSFTFVSSIATVLNATRTDGKVLERLYDWEAVGAVGYGQSKWVAESILASAAIKTGLDVRIARLGQIVGDTKHGRWKASEAYPTVVQSAVTIGALPVIEQRASGDIQDVHYWLPVDIAGRMIVDVALARDEVAVPRDGLTVSGPLVFNISNPVPVRWNTDVVPAVKEALTKYGVSCEAVSQHDWLRRLEDSEADVAKNPPRKLMQFFQERYGSDKDLGEPELDMKNTFTVSPTLRDEATSRGRRSGLSKDLIMMFVDYWVTECWKFQARHLI